MVGMGIEMTCTTGTCGTGAGYSGPAPGDPDNNSILTATAAFGGIDVSWTYPETNPEGVAHVILYRSTGAIFDNAVRHAVVNGTFFYDKTTGSADIEYFYWIQIVSVNGTYGAVIGPASATARPPIATVIEQLSNQIENGHLSQALKENIARINENALDIVAEATQRLEDMAVLAAEQAATQEHSDETRVLLADEVVARNTTTEALIESLNLYYAYAQDTHALLLEEQTIRASEDDALSTQVTTLVAQTDANSAAVEDEATARATADEAIGERITTVESISGRQNLLVNPEFAINLAGWTAYSDNGSNFGRTTPSPGTSYPERTVAPGGGFIHQPDAGTSGIGMATQTVFAEPGKLYQFSAYLGVFRCTASIDLVFKDSAGTVLLDSSNASIVPADNLFGGTALSDFKRVYFNVTAPAGTASMTARVLKEPTESGSDSILFFTRLLLLEITDSAAALLPYARSSAAVQQAMRATNGQMAEYELRTDVNGLLAGFGLVNDGETSEFGVYADTFWVGKNNTDKIKPFIISGDEVFINQAVINQLTFTKLRDESGSVMVEDGRLKAAYVSIDEASIEDASISEAKIQDAAITTAKIGDAEVETLKIAGEAVIVPRYLKQSTSFGGTGYGDWMTIISLSVTVTVDCMLTVLFGCNQGYTSEENSGFHLKINSTIVADGYSGTWNDYPNLIGALAVTAGTHTVEMEWSGHADVTVSNPRLVVMGCMR